LGIYAYRADFLKRYVTWDMAPIEAAESLEQLRVLWQGERIAVSIVDQSPPTGIDTEEDYQRLLEQLNAVSVE
jgi:3-deoxy-manno-octulosonate cytidylyltransferase (CMP-KDO synthetase)